MIVTATLGALYLRRRRRKNRGVREAIAEDETIASPLTPDPPLTSTLRETYVCAFACLYMAFVPVHVIFLVPSRIRVTQPLACSVLRCKQRRGPRTSLHKWFLDRIKNQEPHYPCGGLRRSRRHRMATCPLSQLNLRPLPPINHGVRACGGSEGFTFVDWSVVEAHSQERSMTVV